MVGIVEAWLRDGDVEHREQALAHAFRHTGAMRYLRNGLTLDALRDLLGHASIETTSRYLRLSQDDLAAAVRGVASPTAPTPGMSTDDIDSQLDDLEARADIDDARNVIAEHLDGMDPELAAAIQTLVGGAPVDAATP